MKKLSFIMNLKNNNYNGSPFLYSDKKINLHENVVKNIIENNRVKHNTFVMIPLSTVENKQVDDSGKEEEDFMTKKYSTKNGPNMNQ